MHEVSMSDVIISDLNIEIEPDSITKALTKTLVAGVDYKGPPALTVQQLIDLLSEIDNKSLPVFVSSGSSVQGIYSCPNRVTIEKFSY